MGINYELSRIDKFRPLTGLIQLYILTQSYFFSGVYTGLLTAVPLTLIKFIKSNAIRLFCFLLLLATTVTLPQYDLRSTLRILQILMFTSVFSISINRSIFNSKKI